MNKLITLIIIACSLTGCIPNKFEKKCIPAKDLIGTFIISNPYVFLESLEGINGTSAISFNKVQITNLNGEYKFELIDADSIIKTIVLNLKKNNSGVFEHPQNHHFSTKLIYSKIGGYNRYFGINRNNDLITYSTGGGCFLLLAIPYPGEGIGRSNEWKRQYKQGKCWVPTKR